MDLYIKKARTMIKEFLPVEYVNKVLEKLPEGTSISKGTIRNVKNELCNRLDVLNALVEVALEIKPYKKN